VLSASKDASKPDLDHVAGDYRSITIDGIP